jgi:hypothetical protein
MQVGKMGRVIGVALCCLAGAAAAAEPASGYDGQQASAYKAEIEAALTGAAFSGSYVRDGSPYTLHFDADGKLTDNRGGEGRWWVNDEGEYCREWSTGPLAGSNACLEVLIHGKRMAVYSGNERVLDGMLVRDIGAVMGTSRRSAAQ